MIKLVNEYAEKKKQVSEITKWMERENGQELKWGWQALMDQSSAT